MKINKPAIMIGAGGHALVLLDMLLQTQTELLAVVSPNKPNIDALKTFPWLDNDRLVSNYNCHEILLINAIGSTGEIKKREAVFTRHSKNGYSFMSLLHPTVKISSLDVKFETGLLAMTNSLIGPGVTIGKNVLINSGVIIEHETTIGSHCHIASGSVICGNCQLGKKIHVGAGSTINQNICIGDGAIIASGSVVTRDVPSHTLVAGVPAKIKRTQERFDD